MLPAPRGQYEVYKEDLQEFAGNVSQDAERVMEDVRASELLEKARVTAAEGTNYLVTHLVEGIADDDGDEVATPVSRLDSKLAELQKDFGTFCTVPTDDRFETFSFVAAEHEEAIISLLAGSPVLTSNYNKFVPTVVSYDDFWKRYFFRAQKVREREEQTLQQVRDVQDLQSLSAPP